jgi:type I restriction enzyme S subunit
MNTTTTHIKKEKVLVPTLRFNEFNELWELHKIGEFVKDRKEMATSKAPLYSLTIENGVVPKSKRYERSFLVKGDESAYKLVYPHDFAFNPMNLRFGALAKYKGSENVAVSKYYDIFYSNDLCNADYLEYYLTSYNMIQFYNKMSTGTLEEKKRVHYLDFIHFKKLFPSLPEQQKIASFLSAVDEKIQQLTKKKALLEQYKKGVMQQLFSGQLRFKDENGNAYPEWEDTLLGDCLKYVQPTKYLVSSTEYDNSFETPVLTAGKTFVLGYTDETENICTDYPLIIFDDFTTASKYVDFPFKAKSSAMKLLLAKEGVDVKFMFEAMQNIKYEIGGHGRHWISIFSQLVILVPSIEEQQKIASYLSSIDTKIEAVNNQITQTQTFKKGLLQQMFV